MSDPRKNVLVVEDDNSIRRILQLSLEGEGYRTETASTCRGALDAAEKFALDLIILDLGLPDCDALGIIERMAKAAGAPIIVVTARDQEAQKVAALDAGANDYVTKPFSVPELLARIRAALRAASHAEADAASVYTGNGLTVDREKRLVSVDGADIHLTPNEYALLLVFIDNRGKALTHRVIQREVWGYPATDNYTALRVLTASLRRKLHDKPSAPRFIETEVGVGYRFIAD